WQQDLLETTRHLIRLRREQPVLRRRTFFTGEPVDDNGTMDVAWFGSHGRPLSHEEWESGTTHALSMLLDGSWIGADSVLLLLHGSAEDAMVTLPDPSWVDRYELLWSSEWERPTGNTDSDRAGDADSGTDHDARDSARTAAPGEQVAMTSASMRIYRVRRAE